MGCLRAEKIIDYLADPLQKCLQDENPYVRKTAALAVAKLYDLKPELAVDNGFVEQLKDMVGDSNPMVSPPSLSDAPLCNLQAALTFSPCPSASLSCSGRRQRRCRTDRHPRDLARQLRRRERVRRLVVAHHAELSQHPARGVHH